MKYYDAYVRGGPRDHPLVIGEWPDLVELKPQTVRRVMELPQPQDRAGSRSLWFAGRRPTQTRLDGPLGSLDVDLAVCIEADGTIRASEIACRGFGPTAILDAICAAMLQPKPGCKRYRPALLALDDEAMAETLEPLLTELGIQTAVVEVGEPIDAAVRRMTLLPLQQPLMRG